MDSGLAAKVLSWIVSAVRPIKISELQHAIAISNLEDEENFLEEDALPDSSLLVDVCCGMVTIDEKSRDIRLIHYTTQQYFEEIGPTRFPDAEMIIARACIKSVVLRIHLHCRCSRHESMRSDFDSAPINNNMYQYALEHWAHHSIKAPEERVANDIMSLLQSTQAYYGGRRIDFTCSNPAEDEDEGDGVSALWVASHLNLTDTARLLLDNGADANALTGQAESALLEAAKTHHSELAVLLADRGAKLEVESSSGETALYIAVRTGQVKLTFELLQRGANVHATNRQGTTALQQACLRQHPAVVQILLGRGADITALTYDGFTALHLAAESKCPEAVKMLLQAGADANACPPDGTTALHLAAFSADEESIRLLIQNGADIFAKTSRAMTPLHYVAQCGKESRSIPLLLDRGASINAVADTGETPLYLAVRYGHTEKVSKLLDRGADTNVTDAFGNSLLRVAIKHSHEESALLLLERVESPTVMVAEKETTYLALESGLWKVAKAIMDKVVESGEELSQDFKDTTLFVAIAKYKRYQQLSFLEMLLDLGFGVNTICRMESASTPLHIATECGWLQIAELLLRKGAAINATDKYGNTALHVAVLKSKGTLVKLFMEKGADRSTSNIDGKTPLNIAEEEGSNHLVQLLTQQDSADIGMVEEAIEDGSEIADIPIR
jgi:ankyrin repeat protein